LTAFPLLTQPAPCAFCGADSGGGAIWRITKTGDHGVVPFCGECAPIENGRAVVVASPEAGAALSRRIELDLALYGMAQIAGHALSRRGGLWERVAPEDWKPRAIERRDAATAGFECRRRWGWQTKRLEKIQRKAGA
jgi:hypothetical protein